MTHADFLTHVNILLSPAYATHDKISTYVRILWIHTTRATTLKFDPHHPQIHTLKISTPPSLSSKLNVEHTKELHKNHNQRAANFNGETETGNVEKLVPNLKDENTYVVHIKSLNQALKYGLKLKIIYRIVRFEQSY